MNYHFDYNETVPLHADDLDWENHPEDAVTYRIAEIKEWRT